MLRQARDGWQFKQFAQGNVDVKASAQARNHARGEQRMAAELEEVVVDTDLVELQYFAPDLSDQFFNFCARFDESLIELRPLSIWAAAGHCGRSFR